MRREGSPRGRWSHRTEAIEDKRGSGHGRSLCILRHRSPAARVWERIRDFNALPDWHPAIAESRIEGGGPSDQVGCVRAFRLADGGFLRERLLALSDYDFSVTYSILESPMEVETTSRP